MTDFFDNLTSPSDETVVQPSNPFERIVRAQQRHALLLKQIAADEQKVREMTDTLERTGGLEMAKRLLGWSRNLDTVKACDTVLSYFKNPSVVQQLNNVPPNIDKINYDVIGSNIDILVADAVSQLYRDDMSLPFSQSTIRMDDPIVLKLPIYKSTVAALEAKRAQALESIAHEWVSMVRDTVINTERYQRRLTYTSTAIQSYKTECATLEADIAALLAEVGYSTA